MHTPRETLEAAGKLCQTGRVAEAVELCKEATRHFPGEPAILNMLGLCYFSLRQAAPAVQAFQQALESAPNAAHLHHNMGLALQMDDRWPEALTEYRKATELTPADEPPHIKLAELLLSHGLASAAEECLTTALAHLPNSVRLWLLLATARVTEGNPAGAEEAYRRALELSPAAANSFGFWLQVEGRFEESFRVFEGSLSANPNQGMAYYALLDRSEAPETVADRLAQMKQLVDDPAMADEERLYLHYALGKAYDQTGQYELAMQNFDRANALAFRQHNYGRPFDKEHLAGLTDETIRGFTAEALAARAADGSTSTRPIFIVGMVRSGTTLLDQILSSHPTIGSAGEVRFWMDAPAKQIACGQFPDEIIEEMAANYQEELSRSDADSPNVIDKMPLNFGHLGLIHLVFPRAKILHIRRNPIDTCLSIYQNYLGAGASFTYDKDHIAFYYGEYLRLMEHWRSAIPRAQLIEVDYEDLVASPEATICRILGECGLPWDEACLRHEQNRRTVNTPSRWQVRQPIYATSINRWRHYEPWLGEFRQLL